MRDTWGPMPHGHFKKNRYQFLLLALLLQFALRGWMPENDHVSGMATLLWLAAAVYAIHLTRRQLAAVAAVALVIVSARFNREATVIGDGMAILITGALGWAILRHIVQTQRVNFDTVCASLSVYIMIGVVFATIYYSTARQLMNADGTGTSAFSGLTPELEDPEDPEEWRAELAYFSYVTMTTLGYGDITPKHPSTRSFAILQAIIGQIYLLTLVAGLVALQVAGSGRKKHGEPADPTGSSP